MESFSNWWISRNTFLWSDYPRIEKTTLTGIQWIISLQGICFFLPRRPSYRKRGSFSGLLPKGLRVELSLSEGRRQASFWISPVGAGPQSIELFSTAFPGHQRITGREVEHLGHEAAPVWGTGTAGWGAAHHAATLTLHCIANLCDAVVQSHWCYSSECRPFGLVVCKQCFTSFSKLLGWLFSQRIKNALFLCKICWQKASGLRFLLLCANKYMFKNTNFGNA